MKRNIRNFLFSGSLLKHNKFFKLGARKFHYPKYKKCFHSGFYYFSSSESSLFRKYKKFLISSLGLNVRQGDLYITTDCLSFVLVLS